MALCLFGVDGSGKTSLARGVAAYLGVRGFRVSVVWMRGTHTAASLLARMLARFSVFRGSCNPYYGVCIPSRMRRLWLWVEFLSVLPVVLLRFVVPRLSGRVVVAERSFADFLVWLVVTLGWGGVVGSFVGRSVASLMFSLCGRVVYVRADLDTLVGRRRGSREEGLIPLLLRVYDAVAGAIGAPCVDTSGKPVGRSVGELLEIIGGGHG